MAKNLRTTATGTEDPEGESSGQDYVFPATEFFHDVGTFMLGGTRTITISNYVWRGGTIHTMQGANPNLAGTDPCPLAGDAHDQGPQLPPGQLAREAIAALPLDVV